MKGSIKWMIATVIVLGSICGSNIFGQKVKPRYVEYDAAGDVPIGTSGTGSKLAVGGVIESTVGGVKYPDGTLQTSAGITQVATSGLLTGNGTPNSPLTLSSLPTAGSPEALRQPVVRTALFGPNPGFFYVTANLDTVPTGKLLVVEFVSGYSATVDSHPLPTFDFLIGTTQVNMIPAKTWANGSVGFRTWFYSEAVKFYVQAGQTLTIRASGQAENRIYLNGYYVDAP